MEEGVYEKHRNQTGYGKGDKRRPTDNKKFRENFDAIDWSKKPNESPQRRDSSNN